MAKVLKFTPLHRGALTIEAVTRIKDMILDGSLKPGSRLPPERELAAALNLSRNSLREAIRALVLMNILQSRQGDGTYVTSLEPTLLVEPISFILNIDNDSVFHLFEVRQILESGATYLAAERITDDELHQLEACLQELADARLGNLKKFVDADVRFHSTVLEAARNPLITSLMSSVGKLALATRSKTVGIPGVRARTMSDHIHVYEALAARNPERARQAMAAHIMHVAESLREGQAADALEKQGEAPDDSMSVARSREPRR